jgi:F0F1-type ATP synthase membrane subunit b/b'
MNRLSAMLPELSIFPLFGSISGGTESNSQGQSGNHISEEELAARIATAHALGMVKGGENARAEIAQEMNELRASHKSELETARKTWVEEASDQSIRLIGKALADLETGISQSLQQVLAPFIGKMIPLAAMAELEKILESALKDDFKGSLFLSGPEDLVAELKTRLETREIDVIAEAAPGMELRARSTNFSITTRIKSWVDGINGAAP